MRILHLTDHYPPVLGGIETHVAALAQRQAHRGDDVTVLTSTPSTADGQHSHDPGPVTVHRARSLLDRRSLDLAAFDVVHAHLSVVAPFTSPVAARGARRGVPTVVTVHSFWNGMGPIPGLAAGLAGLRSAPVLWTAVSRAAATQLRRQLDLRPTLPVHVLPNAVAVQPRSRTPSAVGRPVRVVTTMRVARRKRPGQLVSIVDDLRRLTDVPLEVTIVGDGPLRGTVERLLLRRDLGQLVSITGRLSPVGVLEQLARADVYVAPAVLESFGLAALEARCVGLPVVGHAGSGLTEFVTDGVEGLLCRSDDEITRSLQELVEDRGLRTRMSEHNRTVRSRMTWDNALRAHDEVYAEARAPRPRAVPRLSPARER
jgi:glycosyltransferase involved in cell wall biosynthesis